LKRLDVARVESGGGGFSLQRRVSKHVPPVAGDQEIDRGIAEAAHAVEEDDRRGGVRRRFRRGGRRFGFSGGQVEFGSAHDSRLGISRSSAGIIGRDDSRRTDRSQSERPRKQREINAGERTLPAAGEYPRTDRALNET